MKKNRMMRLASVLLVLTLLSTSVISGTFAKYTTSVTSNDKARVAKWGFEATNNSLVITDLFKNSYDGTVNSEVDVIAPGTQNSVDFTFEYDTTSNGVKAPEVDYTFEVAVETSGTTTNLDKNKNFKWKLDNTEYDTFAQLKTALEALDGNQPNNKYDAGKLPTAFYGTTQNGTITHTIGWEWKFDDITGGASDNEDVLDTEMGNADTLEDVSIKITITATQID